MFLNHLLPSILSLQSCLLPSPLGSAKSPLRAEIQTTPSSSPPFSEEQLPLLRQDVATVGGGGSKGRSVRFPLSFLLRRHFLLLLQGGNSSPVMRQAVQLWSKFCSCLATPRALASAVSTTETKTVGAGERLDNRSAALVCEVC